MYVIDHQVLNKNLEKSEGKKLREIIKNTGIPLHTPGYRIAIFPVIRDAEN